MWFFKKKTEENIANKRQYSRVKTRCLVKYKKTDEQDLKEPWLINAKDISEGGVMLTAYEQMAQATRIELQINLPDNPKPITALCKVAWCRKIPETRYFRVGISFVELSTEDRAAVRSYIEMVRKSDATRVRE